MISISCSALLRVVGADLGAVAVLERRDDAAAVGVVLRVGGGDDEDVERQADAVAADLDVALFHDVEEADLDALGEVGQLVDAEDAAVGARDQAVVDRQLVGEVAALGDLDRVDLADEVGDGDVGRGELLAVAAVAADPVDLGVVAVGVDAGRGSGVQIGSNGLSLISQPAMIGDLVVEEVDEGADEAGLGLAALAEEDDVLAGEDGVLELRDDGLFVADDAGEVVCLLLDALDEVLAHLLLHGERLVAGVAQLSNRSGLLLYHGCSFASMGLRQETRDLVCLEVRNGAPLGLVAHYNPPSVLTQRADPSRRHAGLREAPRSRAPQSSSATAISSAPEARSPSGSRPAAAQISARRRQDVDGCRDRYECPRPEAAAISWSAVARPPSVGSCMAWTPDGVAGDAGVEDDADAGFGEITCAELDVGIAGTPRARSRSGASRASTLVPSIGDALGEDERVARPGAVGPDEAVASHLPEHRADDDRAVEARG